jgi:hypothetical protein
LVLEAFFAGPHAGRRDAGVHFFLDIDLKEPYKGDTTAISKRSRKFDVRENHSMMNATKKKAPAKKKAAPKKKK